MDDKLFNQLLESTKEAAAISRGERKPARVTEFTPLDVKAVRKKLHCSQTEFAHMIGVSPGTLRNWEQGRRSPTGPARALLRIVDHNPELAGEALA